MLSCVDALKQIIADIQINRGIVIEHTTPSPDLLQRLREYAVQCLAETTKDYLLFDWFTEGYFDEYVRVCVVHLHKLGITADDRIYSLLTKVINSCTEQDNKMKYPKKHNKSFEEQLVLSLKEFWDNIGDERTQLYTLAEHRWLITWSYQESQWKATGLGRMFMELSSIQAAIFFLSIDIIFATGTRDLHHISRDVLHNLQSHTSDTNAPEELLLYSHRNLLTRLGILYLENDDNPYSHIQLTPIGQTVLRTVLNKDNPFHDAALAIIRTEEVGGTFNETTSEINNILHLVDQTDLINKANQESIHLGVQLFRTGNYLDSLRVVYPSIEAIISMMLIKAGEIPEQLNGLGLVKKAQRLEQRGIIPLDVSQAMEVFTVRNRVLHGNFSPPKDYVFPLCLLALRYLRRLLTEYNPV